MTLDVEALYRSYQRPVRWYIDRRMAGADAATIEDLAADVWERVVRAAPRYRDTGAPVTSWLYCIARNLLADRYRQRSRKVTIIRLGEIKPFVEHVGTSDHLARLDTLASVTAALAALPARQRAVIIARFWEGRRHAEIGHSITLNGSKKLQDRALANLRRALEAA